jgi:hypothetical protein
LSFRSGIAAILLGKFSPAQKIPVNHAAASNVVYAESNNARGTYTMHIRWFLKPIVSLALIGASIAPAQSNGSQTRPAASAPVAPAATPAPNDKDVVNDQAELIRLLRLSPTLTTVVSHDPSLLSNQEYVARNNPQLAQFLAAHPEVARNPEFYLFSRLNHQDGEPDVALERAVWPDVYRSQGPPNPFEGFLHDLSPLLAFACFLSFSVWVIRVILENRRWVRTFKLQSEVHTRLIDKFGSNAELASYMQTEAGRRFLEAAPIAVSLENGSRVPNAVARVLTPLQIGTVLILLGIGLLLLGHTTTPEIEQPMNILGTIILMPGIGFIISAGITWIVAARLGLMPDTAQQRLDSPYSSPSAFKDRQ